MASALINGLLQQDYSAKQLHVVEINAENREKIKDIFGVSALADLESGVIDTDVIVLSVKPQHLYDLTQQLSPFLKRQLIISIVAGIRVEDIARWLGVFANNSCNAKYSFVYTMWSDWIICCCKYERRR